MYPSHDGRRRLGCPKAAFCRIAATTAVIIAASRFPGHPNPSDFALQRRLTGVSRRWMATHQPDSAALVQAPPFPPRLRVAYLITNSEVGGAQSHVADLLRALGGPGGPGIDATLLAGGDGPLFAAARAAGAQTMRLRRLDNALSPLRALGALREVVKALREAAPDLIHVHSAKASALGRLAAWWLGIPVVYTVHGFAFKRAAPPLRRMAAYLTEWCLAPLTSRLICVAQAERDLAATLPIAAHRIGVIRNGLPDITQRAEPEAPLRRIVMVARLAAPKRPDILMRAFAQAGLDDCELVMAGEGPAMAALQALAAQLAPARITLCGNVTDIPALLASAQLFVLVSDHEGLPLSILEAMRAGLPVLASDLPGIREQLGPPQTSTQTPVDESDGVLVAENEVASFTGALKMLASTAELRARLGGRARARWEREFRLGAMAGATWQVYRAALAEAGGRATAGTEGA